MKLREQFITQQTAVNGRGDLPPGAEYLRWMGALAAVDVLSPEPEEGTIVASGLEVRARGLRVEIRAACARILAENGYRGGE